MLFIIFIGVTKSNLIRTFNIIVKYLSWWIDKSKFMSIISPSSSLSFFNRIFICILLFILRKESSILSYQSSLLLLLLLFYQHAILITYLTNTTIGILLLLLFFFNTFTTTTILQELHFLLSNLGFQE